LDLRLNDGQSVTASVGIVTEIPDSHTREDNLLEWADQALYRNKSASKNKEVY
ncbi:MAG: GGDEF domain-containing protein, partial [Kangiella sp.]|nr:GGDEF domain-containing protein [Kangiella sp.]